MPPFLEIACFNPTSARIAAAAGADRIEFCADGSVGGITPSLADFIALKQKISIPIYVMIRPRGANFNYTDEEYTQMKDNIIAFREASADGLVLGILKAEGKVDVERCKELVRLAGPRKCTFHRAFDEIIGSWEEAISDIEECGFSTILTSAGKPTALLGSEQLKSMVAYHASPDIIVGGGVRSGHLKDLHEKLKANWYHSSAIIDGGDTASAEEVKALREALGK